MPKTWADQINLSEAWTYSRGAGVRIALLDTGVAPLPALGHVRQRVFNHREGDHDGHGTRTAALIAARREHGRKFFGVAYESELTCYSVSDPSANWNSMYFAGPVSRAIRSALEDDVDLICCPFDIYQIDADFEGALEDAAAQDVPILVSAGNDPNARPAFPTRDQPVIHVGGVDRRSRILYRWEPWMSVTGPGRAIRTLLRDGRLTEAFWGTSAAAPIVTGVAALGISLARSLDRSGALALRVRRELRDRLETTSTTGFLVDPPRFLASIS